MARSPSSLLLVEGKNDEHVLYALLKQHQIPEVFQVHACNGIDHLLELLPLRLEESGRECLGLVLDADSDPIARWSELARRLSPLGYAGPAEGPVRSGAIFPSPDTFHPRVGIWMMPDNQNPGGLEEFLLALVPATDRLLSRAREAIGAIPLLDRLFVPAHLTKAEMYTWLAWQETPGQPPGLAITAHSLDGTRPIAAELVNWLHQLFVAAPPDPTSPGQAVGSATP
ncbi:MAG: hypothetical protein FJX77_13670 [Armatimonadetes bacterium]|nr:hypothetical protein [Armatimonadota bacterium]